jgi:hypothetical protein
MKRLVILTLLLCPLLFAGCPQKSKKIVEKAATAPKNPQAMSIVRAALIMGVDVTNAAGKKVKVKAELVKRTWVMSQLDNKVTVQNIEIKEPKLLGNISITYEDTTDQVKLGNNIRNAFIKAVKPKLK